ncbi:MAG: 16S rRNA processing protein RimM [Salinivirgaceae bacterium]|nr:MAG: 16S rRNA processing protein RimM [Salinivirgaceae bacterium]
MIFQDCVHLGTITKTHGVDGKLVLITKTNLETKDLREPIFIEIDGLLVPFFLISLEEKRKDQYIIELELVPDLDEAAKLIGHEVYVEDNDAVLTESFDLSALEGLLIIDQNKGELGPCKRVDEISGNYLLIVDIEGDEVMIPFTEDFIVEIFQQENYLLLDLPDGLIDLNQ